MSVTLTEFVTARLDEDEAVARDCAEMFPPPWDIADRGWRVRIYASEVPEVGDHAEPGWVRHPVVMEVEPDRNIDDPEWLTTRVEHVRRHNPARVLAQVEAMRRIAAEHHAADLPEWIVLRALATIWREHPDFDPAWA